MLWLVVIYVKDSNLDLLLANPRTEKVRNIVGGVKYVNILDNLTLS
jgi:hypothetical protein